MQCLHAKNDRRLGWKAVFQKRWAIGLSAVSLATGLLLATQSSASAQAAYGSYVGIGGSLGLTEGSDLAAEDSSSGGVVAFRYRILEIPISLRAQALIGQRTAFVPTVSYDQRLNWNTTAYLGAGASLVTGGDVSDTSPVGNQSSFVIQPGIDYTVPNSNLVLFGNAVIAFDGYQEGGGTAASIQAGLGWNFGR